MNQLEDNSIKQALISYKGTKLLSIIVIAKSTDQLNGKPSKALLFTDEAQP